MSKNRSARARQNGNKMATPHNGDIYLANINALPVAKVKEKDIMNPTNMIGRICEKNRATIHRCDISEMPNQPLHTQLINIEFTTTNGTKWALRVVEAYKVFPYQKKQSVGQLRHITEVLTADGEEAEKWKAYGSVAAVGGPVMFNYIRVA